MYPVPQSNHQVIIVQCFFSILFLQGCVWCTNESSSASTTNDWTPNEDSWHYWWSYSGVSGPSYWGLLNLDWSVCDKGRRQSPIDIQTSALVYDPHLGPLECDNNLINGVLYNDGHAIVFNASVALNSKSDNTLLSGSSGSKTATANGSLMASTRRKRQAVDEVVVGQALSWHKQLEPETDGKSSVDILRELGNSVQMSINQIEPIERVANNEELLADDAPKTTNEFGSNNQILLSGAGLAYSYKFEALYLRFGLDSKSGSEHLIDTKSYAAELQLIAYNSVLYKTYAEALTKPHGLLAVAILIDVLPPPTQQQQQQQPNNRTSKLNGPLESLLARLGDLKHRGASTAVRGLNLSALLPENEYFITYDGSITTPGCHETVTWVVLNKALYITSANLDNLRSISADEQSSAPTGTLIAGNLRPPHPINNRPVRTNIRPNSNKEIPETCTRLWTRYQYKQAKAIN